MKQRFQGIIIGIIIGVLFTSGMAFAKQMEETIKVTYDNIKILINGTEYAPTDVVGNVVEPFIYNGTTYVPIRAISQAFGRKVDWDANSNSVEIGANNSGVSMFTDADIVAAKKVISDFFELYSNGKYQEMKTMVSGELLGWDFSESVYGMSKAKLTKCEYNENLSHAYENVMVFDCSFEMTPASHSVYTADQKEASFYIDVKKTNNQFSLHYFSTGK